jgi:hypothetical protein
VTIGRPFCGGTQQAIPRCDLFCIPATNKQRQKLEGIIMLHDVLRGLIIAIFITGFAASSKAQGLARAMNASSIVGTWTGESICVGNRPACKNETVVYRFEPVAGRSTLVTLFADKIIKGKRVPM